MRFLVFDSMMPDEPALLFGECDDEQMLSLLMGRRGDSWTRTVQNAIAQRGAPSDLSRLARLNPRFQVVLTHDDQKTNGVDLVDLIGGSSGIAPGQAPTAPSAQDEILAQLQGKGRAQPSTPSGAPTRRARMRRALSEGIEKERE